MRCKNFGRICDGYEVRKICKTQAAPKPETRNRNLLPTTLAPISIGHPSQSPIEIAFQDDREEGYFRLFRDETANELSGGFDSQLWNRLVLQACHNEPCILHGVIAISALDRACKTKQSSVLYDAVEAHHRFAIHQYSKALKGLGDVICRNGDSLRTVLIASLLIFCFENFHGDVRLALTNVQSAVRMMHNWLADNTGTSAHRSFSPSPNVIEDDLVTAFARLDVHLMSWIENPQLDRPSILKYATTEPKPIPAIFNNVVEAKAHWEHIVNRVFSYLGEVPETKQRRLSYSQNGLPNEKNPPTTDPAVSEELRLWCKAFNPVLSYARTQAGESGLIGAATLRLHALTLELSLRSRFLDQGKAKSHYYDIFLPEYCEMVAICREVALHPRFVKSFVFDAGIVPSLFVVITKCRDRMVREEAISILKMANPRREGVWDSLMVAKIGEELSKYEDLKEMAKGMKWVEVHLSCLNTTFDLPLPPGTKSDELSDAQTDDGDNKGYLLGWVERCVKISAIPKRQR